MNDCGFLGSIKEAELQFTGSVFVEEYKESQDGENQNTLVATPQQIGEKLYKIIEKADYAYKVTIENQRINLFFTKFKRIVNIEDEEFRVSVIREEGGIDGCSLCDFKVVASAIYKIKKVKTFESIMIDEVSLHIILAHEYSAIPGQSLLDPSRVCRVLGFKCHSRFILSRAAT